MDNDLMIVAVEFASFEAHNDSLYAIWFVSDEIALSKSHFHTIYNNFSSWRAIRWTGEISILGLSVKKI